MKHTFFVFAVVFGVLCGGASRGLVFAAAGDFDLESVIEPKDKSVHIGDSISYTITATNHGPKSANGVLMSIGIVTIGSTDGSTIDSMEASQGACSLDVVDSAETSFAATCNLGTLNAGTSATVQLVVTANGASSVGARVVTPDPLGTEPNDSNNNSSATVELLSAGSGGGSGSSSGGCSLLR